MQPPARAGPGSLAASSTARTRSTPGVSGTSRIGRHAARYDCFNIAAHTNGMSNWFTVNDPVPDFSTWVCCTDR